MTRGQNTPVFLKAIHIQGFKSFADKIKIELQPGMSVIVGPNGSGKSNIADAVRWVLGEQSAKSLRGTKMEDVIFGGSTSRRSVGLAEVSLIFDNSSGLFPLDYEEVVITRRVYRDGEGQFFINRTACRLKDIQELFLDTGSGKEGFSIIGQGRIEEILNLKSEERRLLIEEVAGISKFRHRKKEALKKIEETQQNLERVDDIISEVESRIEPLARQAEVARQSKVLTSELESKEITLLVNDLTSIKSRLVKAEQNIRNLNDEYTVLAAANAENEEMTVRSKYELDLLEQKVQEVQAEVYSLENNVKEAAHELSLMSERQGFVKEQAGRLSKEISTAEERLAESQDKIVSYGEKETYLLENMNQASKKLQEKEIRLAELRSASEGKQLEELKSEIFEILAQKSRLSNELAEISNKKDSALKKESQLKGEITAKQEERDKLISELNEQEQEIQKINVKETQVIQRMEENKQQINVQSRELAVIEESYSGLLRKIDQAAARLQALQALQENLEGYHKGVKETIFAYRKGEINCQAVYGTVADNIEVDQKYELAVETALGSALQNVIVEKTEDGRECIAYLKKHGKGRATFLPLEAVRGNRLSLNLEVRKTGGFEGLAADLVSYDKRFTGIMEFLLGRILVADNMDTAIRLAKANNYSVRVVTLQGDQVNIGGSLTGGSSRGLSSGLLGRTREMEDIVSHISRMKSEQERKKQEEIFLKKQLEEIQKNQATMAEELAEMNESKRIMAVEKKHREDRISRLEESLKIHQYEQKEIQDELAGFVSREEDSAVYLQETEDKLIRLQNEQAEMERALEETAALTEKIAEEITTARIETAKLEQELNQTRQLSQEENQRLQQYSANLEDIKLELTNLQNFEEELVKGQDDAEKNIQEYRGLLDDKRRELVKKRQERENLSADAIRREQELQIRQRKTKELEQNIHQNELRLARLQAEWEAGSARLEEEYQITWNNSEEYATHEGKEALQEQIACLKHALEELGPVNFTALEEYPETLNRFGFLTSQRDDLVAAAESLQVLINDLDKNMIERFREGFTAVNQAFKTVFRDLFSGGNAELELDDPDNLLETGVKVIAQPPGKKAQLLSLLSGGERAFTAIALLFAFLKVKPSPFCLLDEIEAALDEANVKRFVQYLKRLSSSTQFILISHRRGTMESADWLFGITMEESGVSKLLTVKLEENLDENIIA